MADIDAPIKLSRRDVVGKGLNRLRADGTVPAVIYNHGQPSIHVMAPETELLRVYRVAGKHHPLNLEVGSDKYLALIKDAHFNPVKRKLQHVVFQAIRQDEAVEAEVPIRLEGDPPAERTGLIVLRQLDAVEIEALPKNLPDELVISAESLVELHDKLVVGDLKAPEGVTILTDAEHPIATVAEPRAVVAEEAAEEAEAAEGEETAEGEAGEGAESNDQSAETDGADQNT
ncbi:MAG TPA: 50S ribosomal protein L25 [Candidatus Saccharimonadales bacterium]|nr:50S ribosomal protein L25 [Candidatus Saccharimonadales bacterium]